MTARVLDTIANATNKRTRRDLPDRFYDRRNIPIDSEYPIDERPDYFRPTEGPPIGYNEPEIVMNTKDWIDRIGILLSSQGGPLKGTTGREFTKELQAPQNDELAKLDRLLQELRMGRQ